MAINLHNISGHTEYLLRLYDFLVRVEGKRYDAYVISNLKTGVLEPHIGVGFQITEDPALGAVLSAFGIDPNPTRSHSCTKCA